MGWSVRAPSFSFSRLPQIADQQTRPLAVSVWKQAVHNVPLGSEICQYQSLIDSWPEIGRLLFRRCLLLFDGLEALLILAELLPQGPVRPPKEIQLCRPRLCVRLGVLDRDVVD